MSASDLVGRHLLYINGTHWQDGPLMVAARIGAICYLDEIIEAHPDNHGDYSSADPPDVNRHVYRYRVITLAAVFCYVAWYQVFASIAWMKNLTMAGRCAFGRGPRIDDL